jgi:hypothetical protein
MITPRQQTELNQLNIVLNNNEIFRGALSTEYNKLNNISSYINMIDLYSYFYKHYDIIAEVFKTDASGFMDPYLAHRVISTLHNLMCKNQFTAAQAVKELRRIRKCADYNKSLG